MDEHAEIYFRAGALGRRAALVGTRLDIWQVMDTVRNSGNSVAQAAEYLNLPPAKVEAAVRYYAVNKEEVDRVAGRESLRAIASRRPGEPGKRSLSVETPARRALLAPNRRAAPPAGHDVVSISERSDLRGFTDARVFSFAQAERRALLTENTARFHTGDREGSEGRPDHFGVIFTSPRRFPRGPNTIGIYVRALDLFLSSHHAEDALINSSTWLSDYCTATGQPMSLGS